MSAGGAHHLPEAVHVPGLEDSYLHHVGIVSPSEERAAELLLVLGLREISRGVAEAYEALCIFGEGSRGSLVELVVPSGGVLAGFNRGAGGLHHVAIAVADLWELQRQLADRRVQLLEPEPVRGAGPFVCNFLAPVYAGGVIVEFVELLASDSAS